MPDRSGSHPDGPSPRNAFEPFLGSQERQSPTAEVAVTQAAPQPALLRGRGPLIHAIPSHIQPSAAAPLTEPRPVLQPAVTSKLAAFLPSMPTAVPSAAGPEALEDEAEGRHLSTNGALDDLPDALRARRDLHEVLGFRDHAGAGLIAAMPHYELGPSEALTVSHLEARLILAEIKFGLGDRKPLKNEVLDSALRDLVQDGYLESRPLTPNARLDEAVRAAIPAAWWQLTSRAPKVEYSLTDRGILAGRMLRAWSGEGEVRSLDGTRTLATAEPMPAGVAPEAFAAAWEVMERRSEAALLEAGGLGRYFRAELSTVYSNLNSDDPMAAEVATEKADEILEGMQTAALQQIDLNYPVGAEGAIRPIDIDHANTIARMILQRGAGRLDDPTLQVQISRLDGIGQAMREIDGAQKAAQRGVPLDSPEAWTTLEAWAETADPLAQRDAASVVRGYLSEVALEVERGAQVVREAVDAFLGKAFGPRAPVLRELLG